MKKLALLPLSCALLIATGCSEMVKQEPVAAVMPAAPQPPVLEKPIPAAYYQSNEIKFGDSLNPTFEAQYKAYQDQVNSIKQQDYQSKLAAWQTVVQAMQQNKQPDPAAQQTLNAPAPALPEAPKLMVPLYGPATPVAVTKASKKVKGKKAAAVEVAAAPAATAVDPNAQLDVASIDRTLAYLESKARHYAPVFDSKPERRFAEEKAEALQKTLNGYADAPNASYDILIRAMKINVMARNMDVGTDSAVKSLGYFDRLLKLKPQDPETQYWYGFSLAEGGGFQEGIPHMNVAVKAGYQEAYLAIANAYMYMDKKPMAISTLNAYKAKYPTDAANADLLISQIKSGQRFSVWQNIPQAAPVTLPTPTAPAVSTNGAAMVTMPAATAPANIRN